MLINSMRAAILTAIFATAARVRAAPPSHLALHLPRVEGLKPGLGPRPEIVGDPASWLDSGIGRAGVRLAAERLDQHARLIHASPSSPLCRWPARGLPVNAQGTKTFPDSLSLVGWKGYFFSIWASNLIAEGLKSTFLTNWAASAAPCSRSMPESSHSTDSGPW